MINNITRHKLIREVLDEDKNINQRLAKITKKTIPKNEVIQLYNQLNQEEIQKLNVFISNIRKILEKIHI